MLSRKEYIDTLEHLHEMPGHMTKSQELPGLFSTPPARVIGPGRRGLRGSVNVLGRQIDHESFLERDFLLQMTFDRTLTAIKSQPVTIHFEHQGKKRRYTPDYATEHKGPRESRFLIELKFRQDLINDWTTLKPQLLAGRRFAREHGMSHIILTEVELRTQSLENAKLLTPYRALPKDDAIEQHLLYKLAALGGEATPKKLLGAAYASEINRKEASDYVFKLIATGRILADIEQPINKIIPIWLDMNGDWRGESNPYSWRPIKLRAAKILAGGMKRSILHNEDGT